MRHGYWIDSSFFPLLSLLSAIHIGCSVDRNQDSSLIATFLSNLCHFLVRLAFPFSENTNIQQKNIQAHDAMVGVCMTFFRHQMILANENRRKY